MITREIERRPLGAQESFVFSMRYQNAKNVRRWVELCQEIHCTAVDFRAVGEERRRACAIACEEVGLPGLWQDTGFAPAFRYALPADAVVAPDRCETVVVSRKTQPEAVRRSVYDALLRGKKAIEYDDGDGMCITRDGQMGPYFRYVQELNYRAAELGRTLMALKSEMFYCPEDVIGRDISGVLARQTLPAGCAIGEFADDVGNIYLMVQNQDISEKEKKAFRLPLTKPYRVYRVNPHNGKQVVVKDSVDAFNLFVMPGDADLLRFQDAAEEAYLAEYVLQK